MRIFFRLRPKKDATPDTPRVLYCRMKIDGIEAPDFSTGIKASQREWNSKAQRIRGNSLRVNDNNMQLEQIRSHLTQLINRHPDFGAHEIVIMYTKRKQEHYYLPDLVDLFDSAVKKNYSNKGTLKSYKSRIDNIRLYIKECKHTKLLAHRISLGIADEFVRWLKQRKLDHQYIVRHTQILKNITQDAVRMEILTSDPLQVFKLKKREKINTDHLTREELLLLETLPWRPTLQRIVDLFLFSCYTGLHYDDAQTLSAENIGPGIDGRLWLFKERGKYAESEFFSGNYEQSMPLHPKALILIEKYGGINKLPKISNKTYNDHLKDIQFIADIKVRLTVKIGRKTFTDIMLNELLVSKESVAAMLGHTTTDHVKHYGRADERRIASEVKY